MLGCVKPISENQFTALGFGIDPALNSTSLPDKEVVVVKVLARDELAVEEQPEVPRPRPPLVRVLELVPDLLGDALGVPGGKVFMMI